MKPTNCNTESAYQQYRQRLLDFINARVRNQDQSEDLLQETFLQFEECCQSGKTCGYPKSYLFKMALNTIADFFKKQKKQTATTEAIQQLAVARESAEAFPCDVYHCTYQFLAKLSPENQAAFIQSDIEQIPQKQIAETLNIPVSTLKSRVQRTRAFLKQEFEKCLEKK